jgi:hypothetical protein
VHARFAHVHFRQALPVDGDTGQTAIGLARGECVIALDEVLFAIAPTTGAHHTRSAFALLRFLTRIAPMAQRHAFTVQVQRSRFATRTWAT